ncbi:hypothetical protein WH390_07465 [Candidatus Arsenophonus nilaparvatae]|uniref:hypothetical protein n=1 Tax=Candidatus Arsenophonus nilaparvatae TaxID=1247023 RepID=UPI000AC0CBB3|nr:hypothetical protein [Candidatus Arsenophonus nilaparvatae]
MANSATNRALTIADPANNAGAIINNSAGTTSTNNNRDIDSVTEDEIANGYQG